MNIFAVSPDPEECARCLDDLRVNKMTTETAQLLSDALLIRNLNPFMKRNNPNHPLVKWVATNENTFLWTVALLVELNKEFCRRTQKPQGHEHGAFARAYAPCLEQHELLPCGERIPFRNSSLFKNEQDTHIAYRQTMIYKWQHYKRVPTWKNAEKPSWANDPIPELT